MKKNVRIAFCGASGTGKTTTAKQLSKNLGLPVNPIGSRSVSSEMGYDSPYDVDAFGRRAEFQKKLFEMKKKWENENSSFITDRTHFDNLTYSLMHDCVGTVTPNFIHEITVATRNYTHIIFFPTQSFLDPGQDPQRIQDLNYHQVYEWILKMLLDQSGFEYYIMMESDLDRRINAILEWVK